MSKPKVLMLLTRDPYAEQSGRAVVLRQRIAQMRATHDPVLVVIGKPTGEARKHPITMLPMAGPIALIANAWRHRGKPMQSWLYYSESTRKRILRLVAEIAPQAVYVDMLRLAPLATAMPGKIAIIADYDDLLSRRYQRAAGTADYEVLGFLAKGLPTLAFLARTFARQLLRSEQRRCAAYERTLLGDIDVALFTSPLEAEMLRRSASGTEMATRMPPILAVPPVIEPRENSLAASGRRLFFLGNLRYAENLFMLRSLADAVERLRQANEIGPDIKIEVIGEHAPDLPSAFDSGHFAFLGRIPDLEILAGEGIFLVPATSGSGIKLKILDGMSLDCPIVTTPGGCDGLAVRANRDLIVAADAVGVLRAALKLRDRERLKAALARRAQAYLARAHSPALAVELSRALAAAIDAKASLANA